MHKRKPIDFYELAKSAGSILNVFHFFMDEFYPGWRVFERERVETAFFLFIGGMSATRTMLEINREECKNDTEIFNEIDRCVDHVDRWLGDKPVNDDESAAVDMANRIIQQNENLPKNVLFVVASEGKANPYKHKNGLSPDVCQAELNKAIGRAKAKGKTQKEIEKAIIGFQKFYILPNYTLNDLAAIFDDFFGI